MPQRKTSSRPDQPAPLAPETLREALGRWVPTNERDRLSIDLPRAIAAKLQRFDSAIATLNEACQEQKIFNAELESVKFDLSRCIDDALDVVTEPHEARWRGKYESMDYDYRKLVWDNVSSYCSFNQASGRIARLTKKPEILRDLPELGPYISCLREIDAIWKAIRFLKPFVLKGRRPSLTPPKEEDLSGTGTCPACEGLFKLTGAKRLVQHGFRISDGYGHYFGYRSGKCFGVEYLPYELSKEGNIAYQRHIEARLILVKENLRRHVDGEIEQLYKESYERGPQGRWENRIVTVLKGDKGFDYLLSLEIARLHGEIDCLSRIIQRQSALILHWSLKPLPHGEAKEKASR